MRTLLIAAEIEKFIAVAYDAFPLLLEKGFELRQILQDVKAANAEPLLMQIRLPANYGRRYNEAFSAIYPKLAKEFDVPLLPFFMEEVYLKPQWMQDDGIHPNRDAQPFIADWMAKQLQPLVNHDS